MQSRSPETDTPRPSTPNTGFPLLLLTGITLLTAAALVWIAWNAYVVIVLALLALAWLIALQTIRRWQRAHQEDTRLLAERAAELAELNRTLDQEVARRTEALREGEARYRELYDRAPIGYHELDVQGRITRVNRTELELLGYTESAMLGRPIWDFIEQRETSAEAVQAKLAGRIPPGRAFQRNFRRADGTTVPCLLEDQVITDAAGEPIGIRSTLQDITLRRRAQEKQERFARELERSNRELEQFAYVASHDLQEPLRMVVSYVQLLARRYGGKLDNDAEDFIRFAVDGAQRMQGMINDLLAYSRVQTKGKPAEPIPADEALDAAVANLTPAIREAGAAVTRDPLPTVLADRGQMVQLFQNLIANAVKFRGQARPQVHVSARQEGGQWVFSVADNGIGLDPKQAERIFSVFQRLHTRDQYPGTGIGLAICKRIVERHRGRIWCESEPGKGTTFLFTLHSKGPPSS